MPAVEVVSREYMGTRIQRLIDDQGITQVECARRASLNVKKLRRIIGGQMPTLIDAQCLEEVLGEPLKKLFLTKITTRPVAR